MLTSKELRVKAWNSLKGKYWRAFLVILVLGLLASGGTSLQTSSQTLTDTINLVDPSEMDETMELGAAVVGTIATVMAVVGMAISLFVGNAADVGLAHYFVRNVETKPSFADAFYGFKVKYLRNIGTLLLVGIKLALWSLLLVVPGIIKSFEYAIIPYILADDPEITSKEAFRKAKEMMMGNKWRLFKLNFSFFGWFVLCVVTCGLGTPFLLPYVSAANAEFYAELKNK